MSRVDALQRHLCRDINPLLEGSGQEGEALAQHKIEALNETRRHLFGKVILILAVSLMKRGI